MTPTEAALVLEVSADTVRDLGDSGQLPMLRTSGGRRLFNSHDVERLRALRKRARRVRSRD